MKDIEGIIHDYRITYKRDAEGDLRYYRALNSLDTAIVAAGQAKRADGKRHSHQYRIKQEVLDRVTEKLITVKSQILACRDFDELWHFINKAIKDISGVGELMIYDTTHRLGAFLNLAPEKVYIHRGVREGAKALGFNGKRESVELEELPKPMQRLSAYELEDILCIYKDDLKRLSSA